MVWGSANMPFPKMSVVKRTWQYGTRKAVKVIQPPSRRVIVVAEVAGKEAFILVGDHPIPLPALHARGIIEFKPGGPTGGYWEWVN